MEIIRSKPTDLKPSKPRTEPKSLKAKKDNSRKRGTTKKKVTAEEPKDPNAGTVIYEITKNAIGPPSPPHDQDIPIEDLPPPGEERIRAPYSATVSILDTPLVSASVSKGIFTYRIKKRKRDGELENELIDRLIRTKTEAEFRAALSDSVQEAAEDVKAESDAARSMPKLAKKKRRVDKAKRALERLAELNMEEEELKIKKEQEEYEGGDEGEADVTVDQHADEELEIVF
ncbi:hypothetical protein ACHAQH_004517 [Verticillium albo-atrum]